MFSPSVCTQLKYYVYRLIDPRNGETFYVGKGKDNRVFMHVKGELGADADIFTEKLQRIREIRVEGFEVAHVIHRHGMDGGSLVTRRLAKFKPFKPNSGRKTLNQPLN
jgi:hypothetical protein